MFKKFKKEKKNALFKEKLLHNQMIISHAL